MCFLGSSSAMVSHTIPAKHSGKTVVPERPSGGRHCSHQNCFRKLKRTYYSKVTNLQA